MSLPESGYVQPVEIVVAGTLPRSGYVQPVDIVGGGSITIGGLITGGTPTDVLFVDTGSILGQDGNFTWNKTTQVLRAVNAQFKGSPWLDVKQFGAVGDNVTDDTAAINAALAAAPARGGVVYLPLATYLITGAGLSTTNRNIVIIGAGKNLSILNYTGNGTCLTFGDINGGNVDGLLLRDFSIKGSAAGVSGILTQTFNGFIIQNVSSSGFSSGIGWDTGGSNSGAAYSCDFYGNSIGVAFTSIGLFVANAITLNSGQILGNATAVQSLVNSASNKLIGINIASQTVSPAVDIRRGVGWIIKGCFFENNAGGAGSSSIRIGTAAVGDISQAHIIEGNIFVENNNLPYGVDVVRGGSNIASFNVIDCTFTTAFYRAETNASAGLVWGNTTPGNITPILSDVSTSADQFSMGVGTNFVKTSTGYSFTGSLSVGTATDPVGSGDFATGLFGAARMVFSQSASSLTIYNSSGNIWLTVAQAATTYDLIGSTTARLVFTANNNVGSIAFKNAGTTIFQILDVGEVWLSTVANENLVFRTNNTSRWFVAAATGNLLASTDASFTIGAAGASRPLGIFVSSQVTVPTLNLTGAVGLVATNQTTLTGGNVGTLTNCPHTGNPTLYWEVSINGSTLCIPCYALS